MYILTIDVGSSSTRALVIQHDGTQSLPIMDTLASISYQFEHDAEGRASINADTLREGVEGCVDACLQHPLASQIEAVGICTFVGNLLIVDADNRPLNELDTYADRRSARYCEAIAQQMDTHALHQRTGALLNSAYYLPKLHLHRALIEAHPQCSVLDFATYCYRDWFGEAVPMSYSVASWSGMLDRTRLTWDDLSVQAVPWVRGHLPELTDYTSVQRGLSAGYRQRWQALVDVPFYLAVGDGASAQVGSGALNAERATLTIGTTSAIRHVITDDTPTVPDGCWSYRIDREHHLIGGALSEGGNIFGWAQDTLQINVAELEQTLHQRSPGAHGLDVLPLLNGERSPGWRSDATGTLHGLRLNTRALDIAHALLEGVALRLAWIVTQLNLTPQTTLMGAGGALHQSPAWAQMIAHATGHTVAVIDTPQVSALGVAQMIACDQRNIPLKASDVPISVHYHASATHTAQFADLQERQRRLYDLMENL
ncbi:MAG: gluconokinase [Anaerolineae bacterium]